MSKYHPGGLSSPLADGEILALSKSLQRKDLAHLEPPEAPVFTQEDMELLPDVEDAYLHNRQPSLSEDSRAAPAEKRFTTLLRKLDVYYKIEAHNFNQSKGRLELMKALRRAEKRYEVIWMEVKIRQEMATSEENHSLRPGMMLFRSLREEELLIQKILEKMMEMGPRSGSGIPIQATLLEEITGNPVASARSNAPKVTLESLHKATFGKPMSL